ncbi:MAG: glycoside hydrolase family 15 protein [Patescibacteria group bacterium]|jgi:glucoamylase
MRALILSNGNILVNLDEYGQVRDFYFPYIGLENHVLGHIHRLGIWIDNQFSWLSSDDWRRTCHFQKASMVGETVFTHKRLELRISFIDAVDTNKNIFLRKILIKNSSFHTQKIKLFFCHEFLVGEHRLANTAFYDPVHEAVIHYKGRRVFLINGMDTEGNVGIHDYTIGVWGYNGQEGSFHDAEDGVLGKNAVDHGPTDSVVALHAKVDGKKTEEFHYWIAVGETIDEVNKLNERVIERSPQQLIEVTSNFWNAWVSKRKFNFYGLSEPQINLFQRSLLIVRAHFDNRGGVIASSDSAKLAYGKEGYTFVWPRDGAFATMALDRAGYSEVTRAFFDFMAEVITNDGYVHHKYLADRSLGSTWHASVDQRQWLNQKNLQLPIQEDETASVVFALWSHYNYSRDIEVVERLYEKLIFPAAKFMMTYRDEKTGLPKESYDLWEEKLGVATYTVASVYGGLTACSRFAQLLGKRKHATKYQEAAHQIKEAMVKHLFSKTRNSFIRTVYYKPNGGLEYEEVIDASSLYGLWFYGVLHVDDPLFQATEKAVRDFITDVTPTSGVIRYEGDEYYRSSDKSNPWFITTLWSLQLDILKAKNADELRQVVKKLNWILKYTTDSGILAEQIHAYSGEPISVCPLTWSHSTYIDTIIMYLEKLEELGICNNPFIGN